MPSNVIVGKRKRKRDEREIEDLKLLTCEVGAGPGWGGLELDRGEQRGGEHGSGRGELDVLMLDPPRTLAAAARVGVGGGQSHIRIGGIKSQERNERSRHRLALRGVFEACVVIVGIMELVGMSHIKTTRSVYI